MTLAETLLSFGLDENAIRQRLQEIHRDALAQSRFLRQANFQKISVDDLAFLFRAYDERFFAGLLRQTLGGRKIVFRLSQRMTSAGGKTSMFRLHTGEVSFEIAIAAGMLFNGFGENDRTTTACGIACSDRLEALQRIFEHELIHLAEQMTWEVSNCRGARFQDIAARFFLHRAHTHNLITQRERAAESGIRRGSRVSFDFEGRSLTGRVNRVTRRATVLVEDSEGVRYSDGLRYKTYYVPITRLKLADKAYDGAAR